MDTLIFSDELDFQNPSYYYLYTNGTVTATGRYLCNHSKPYATYWAYTPAAVYGKHYSQVILSIKPERYVISGSYTISFFAACAPISSSNPTNSIILSRDSSKFGARSGTVILHKSGNSILDITNVINYAAKNYNQKWGLYLIGTGSSVNSADVVTFRLPTFSTIDMSSIVKIHNGSDWVDGTPYIYNGTEWVKSKAVYRHDGSSWIQV